jgi:hypothetical protein
MVADWSDVIGGMGAGKTQSMPKFFFDMHLDTRVIPDTDGVEVADAASALRGCIASIEDGIVAGLESIVVRNELGDEIAWIKVTALRLFPNGDSAELPDCLLPR